MSSARTRGVIEARRLAGAASLLTVALAGTAAFAQAPAGPGARTNSSAPQDMEPAVDTSASPKPDAAPDSTVNPGAARPAAAKPATGAQPTPPSAAQPKQPSASAPARRAGGKALDRLELESTQITGNRELPKVLYIVPWKRPELGDLLGKPVNSLLDEVLAPVDREVFQRETHYYEALADGAQGAAPRAGEGAGEGESKGESNRNRPNVRDEK